MTTSSDLSCFKNEYSLKQANIVHKFVQLIYTTEFCMWAFESAAVKVISWPTFHKHMILKS